MKREKLHIRLPEDDLQGPNPYDSKTPFQPPEHLTLKWWLMIIPAGVLFGVWAWFKNGGHF